MYINTLVNPLSRKIFSSDRSCESSCYPIMLAAFFFTRNRIIALTLFLPGIQNHQSRNSSFG